MANITLTLTEEELHAFEVAKHMMDSGFTDNLALDEEFGDDHYGRAHRGLDSLEAKIYAKVRFENDIAYLRDEHERVTGSHIVTAIQIANPIAMTVTIVNDVRMTTASW